MFRPFRRSDWIYLLSLIFMVFPFGGVIGFHFPLWTIFPSLGFLVDYLLLIWLQNDYRKTKAALWIYHLLYIVGMTCLVEGGMMWFFFFPINLLVWRFEDPIRSYRFITFFISLLATTIFGLLYVEDEASRFMIAVIPIFMIGMYLVQTRSRREAALAELLQEQHRTINLLAAENERNRIGRDLHDSLGHTFAMMTLKTELALKQLNKNKMTAVQKELEELRAISQESMADVRKLVQNLKYRTVTEELSVIQDMFEGSEVALTLENQLETDLLAPPIQSTINMIVRELTTNVIKHAQAQHCQIELTRDRDHGICIRVTDDGRGFGPEQEGELHSIKERLTLVKGTIEIVSRKAPTQIQVTLTE